MKNFETLRRFTLSLTRQNGLGVKTILKILEQYQSIENLLTCDLSDLHNEKIKLQILKARKIEESDFKILENRKIKFKCFWEEDFPQSLKEIPDPPIVLYYVGEWSNVLSPNNFSIVGTRKNTTYGAIHAEKFAYELGNAGFNIVSGMAFGIDTLALKGVLKSSSKAIAVLAGSPDRPSPESNRKIYEEILKNGGVIISETHSTDEIFPGFFVRRNRVVAGLSKGTLVIEAAQKSGSLITANLALDYNREVFALAGSVDSIYSHGTNDLIKKGEAKLVQNTYDILTELGFLTSNSGNKVRTMNLSDLTNEERVVYDCLANQSLNVDDLALKIAKSTAETAAFLSMLELKSLVIKDNQGRWNINLS